ncbi:MAG TPA: glycosyltransferase, partial [Anaerolineales bacterium]
PADSPKIAYVIKRFPHLSETFILHEVLELERQGLPLRIFSLLEPTGKINGAAKEVRAQVEYLPRRFPLGTWKLLQAAARQLRKRPRRFLAACLDALIRFHHLATPGHLLMAAFVAEQAEAEGITHLHAHYANTPTTIARLVHEFTGIPYSFTAHAKDIYLSQKISLAYKMADARFVVTCTEYNHQYLASVAGPARTVPIHRIYHGLDLRAFPSRSGTAPSPRGRPLILSVARLVEKKGLPYLLEACRTLRDRGYDFDCRIVGEGPLRPVIERQIGGLGLTNCVTLWGAEKHERVLEMYQQATLLALPCIVAANGDRDGIPNVLVEALHMGTPVVSTAVSGVPELIEPEVSGLLVPERDSAALADAIARLLDDARLRRRLAQAGQETVLAGFDMASNTRRLMQLFRQSDPHLSESPMEQVLEAGLVPADILLERTPRS